MDKFEIYQWETADHKIFSIMNNNVVLYLYDSIVL